MGPPWATGAAFFMGAACSRRRTYRGGKPGQAAGGILLAPAYAGPICNRSSASANSLCSRYITSRAECSSVMPPTTWPAG